MSGYDRVKAEIEELLTECQRFACKEKMGHELTMM